MPEVLDLPDVNVLVAATNASHVHHEAALQWFAGCSQFATTPVTESGLLRLLLNPAVVGQRVDGPFAVDVLRAIRADSRHRFVPDSSTLAEAQVDTAALAGHRQVTDLHLLNLAVGAGARFVTFDRRIPGLVPGLAADQVVIL